MLLWTEMTLVSFCLFVCNYLLFWCFLMFVLENSKHLIITSFLPRHFWFYGSLLCDLCVGKYAWYAWSIPWKLKNLSLLHLKISSFKCLDLPISVYWTVCKLTDYGINTERENFQSESVGLHTSGHIIHNSSHLCS